VEDTADVRRALPRLHVLERRCREVVTRLTPESGLSCAKSSTRYDRPAHQSDRPCLEDPRHLLGRTGIHQEPMVPTNEGD
jgi:hypothetical protein